jgi:hypothetical protein
MPALLRASRGGRSKERRERVRKRCLANRPKMGYETSELDTE